MIVVVIKIFYYYFLLLLLLYSCIVNILAYITKEMVNLILTGKATSNVFDGVMDLDSGGATKVNRLQLFVFKGGTKGSCSV